MSWIKRHLSAAAALAQPLIAGQRTAEETVRAVLAQRSGFWSRAWHFAALIHVLHRANEARHARAVMLAMGRLW